MGPPEGPVEVTGLERRGRSVILTLLALASVCLILWTIYLGWRLPKAYDTPHWNLAWVGLDTMEIIALVLTTWAAYRRRAVLVFFATAAATMMILDAWFDVTTARAGDIGQSILEALAGEIPAAICLILMATVAWRRVVRQWAKLAHPGTMSDLWNAEIPRPRE